MYGLKNFHNSTLFHRTCLKQKGSLFFIYYQICLLKFMFYKKATKIDKIFTSNLMFTWWQVSNQWWRFCQFCGLLRKHELYLLKSRLLTSTYQSAYLVRPKIWSKDHLEYHLAVLCTYLGTFISTSLPNKLFTLEIDIITSYESLKICYLHTI